MTPLLEARTFLTPLLLFSLWSVAPAGEPRFVLTGEVHFGDQGRLRGQHARVRLRGAHFPFFVESWTSLGGRFKIKNLTAGVYVLSVEIPGWAVWRTSIDVSSSLADQGGRIHQVVSIDTSSSGEARQVSVAQLSLSRRALRSHAKAERLLGKGKIDEAVRVLRKALEMEPRFALALNTLGTIAYQREQFAEAEAYFRQALEADESYYPPLVNLGGALLSQGRYEEALIINRRAFHERPDDPLTNSQLGLSHWGLGQEDEATGFLNRYKELDPGHFSYPRLSLARIFLSRKDFAKARAELEEFLRLHPDSQESGPVRLLLEQIPSGKETRP